VERTAGQLTAIAQSHDAKLSFILVSEVHPESLPPAKSAEELEKYRARKVREFLGPNVSVYFDVDQGAERSLEFTKLNHLYLEDGWQLYRMIPPGHEGSYQVGVSPFLSWWGKTHPPGRAR
jgi:hypothetical protein